MRRSHAGNPSLFASTSSRQPLSTGALLKSKPCVSPGVHLVAPGNVAVGHPQRNQRARPRSAPHGRPVRGAGADVDEPQAAVDRRRRQHAAALTAGGRHRRAPQRRPVGQPIGGEPAARRRQLSPRARADEHDPADDRRRAPEVVIAALRADRRRRPDRRAGVRIQAAHAVGRHHGPSAVHRDAAEEAQLACVGAAAVRRRAEAAPPPPAAIADGERPDLAAQRRSDRDPAGQRRGIGRAARQVDCPPLVQNVRGGGRVPRPRDVVRRKRPRGGGRVPGAGGECSAGKRQRSRGACGAPFRKVARLIPGCSTTPGSTQRWPGPKRLRTQAFWLGSRRDSPPSATERPTCPRIRR